MAGVVGVPHQTVWKVLRRHGFSRRAAGRASRRTATSGPAPAIFCTWTSPATPASYDRDTRSPATAARRGRTARRDGYQYAHAVVDDHSRLAYVELHRDERADTVLGFTRRALDWYTAHGIQSRRNKAIESQVVWTGGVSFARVVVGAGD